MTPRRIVSLVPSLTEALFVLGVGDLLVGRTRYCTHPPRLVGGVTKIGGTKKVDVGRILALEPDLIVAVREENTREDVEALSRKGIDIFLGEPETVAGAVEMLRELADRVGASDERVKAVIPPICRVLKRLAPPTRTRRCFVPIWKNPYMGVGGDTYVHDVIETCGGKNVCGGSTRYPIVTLEEIEAAQPEIILLPDEPYPFSAEDLAEFYALDVPAAREDRIFLVDGKLLTWYGPRMAGSLAQLAALLS